jgi:hypothetical protein
MILDEVSAKSASAQSDPVRQGLFRRRHNASLGTRAEPIRSGSDFTSLALMTASRKDFGLPFMAIDETIGEVRDFNERRIFAPCVSDNLNTQFPHQNRDDHNPV